MTAWAACSMKTAHWIKLRPHLLRNRNGRFGGNYFRLVSFFVRKRYLAKASRADTRVDAPMRAADTRNEIVGRIEGSFEDLAEGLLGHDVAQARTCVLVHALPDELGQPSELVGGVVRFDGLEFTRRSDWPRRLLYER